MSKPKKNTLVLPRLQLREELIKSAPELSKLLAGPLRGGPVKSQQGPSSQKGAKTSRASSREFELPENEVVRRQLAQTKLERADLLSALQILREDIGNSGADLQQEDIDVLRAELAAKKRRLNDLNDEIRALASRQTDLQTMVEVLDRQMPVTPQDLQAQLDQCSKKLEATLKEVQTFQELKAQDLAAENRAHENHTAACVAHAEAVRLQEALAADESTLHRATREMHLAKDKAEQDLQRAQQQSSQTISDWTTKVKDRTKELKRLERENAERRDKMEAAARAREAKERLLRESSMASDLQEAPSSSPGAAPLPRRMPAPAPLEILEGQWGRLHAATGASTPEGVIAFWQELQAKESSLQGLIQQAEEKEHVARQALKESKDRQAASLQAIKRRTESARPSEFGDQSTSSTLQAAEQELESWTRETARLASILNVAEIGARKVLTMANAFLQEWAVQDEVPGPSSAVIGSSQPEECMDGNCVPEEQEEKDEAPGSKLVKIQQGLEHAVRLLLEKQQEALLNHRSSYDSETMKPEDVDNCEQMGAEESERFWPASTTTAQGEREDDLMNSVSADKEQRELDAGAGEQQQWEPSLGPGLPEEQINPSSIRPQSSAADSPSQGAELLSLRESGGRNAVDQSGGISNPHPSVLLHLDLGTAMPSTPVDDTPVPSSEAVSHEHTPAPDLDSSTDHGIRLLNKGFRRATHVGPAWLPPKTPGQKNGKIDDRDQADTGPAVGRVLSKRAQKKLAGHVSKPELAPESSFELNSYSSDDDRIIDKEYLKLRAAKLAGGTKPPSGPTALTQGRSPPRTVAL